MLGEINIVGTWIASADEKRRLVFEQDGIGYIEIELIKGPFFTWKSGTNEVLWQMFSNKECSVTLSQEMELGCIEIRDGLSRYLVFKNAPIPFGFKRFRFVQTFD